MSCFLELGALLRARGPYAVRAAEIPWRRTVVLVAVCGATHGALMGAYGGRPSQMMVTALKVPLLIGFSTALCLPSLFIVNTVAGLRADLAAVLRGILAAQATVAVTLQALAPLLLNEIPAYVPE